MTTNLEGFCSKVAYRSYGIDETNRGIDINTILQLVQVIAPIVIQLIQGCPANQSGLKNSIKNPNWLQRVRFRAQVKDVIDTSGYREYRSLSGKVAEAFIAEAAKLTDEDVGKMVEEVVVLDNWII